MIKKTRLPMWCVCLDFRRQAAFEKSYRGSYSDAWCSADKKVDMIRHDYISPEGDAFILAHLCKVKKLFVDRVVCQ
ncbi:MAG: hypothetical protein A2283_08270 [Lentisphaerae bacterium RIFOXYA12_FULL_48_11]|nr:MAG: hypothetical protein A2283_08270 [Lentisphaerae bacterium RIFOXYA12_FULL_48_11]